MDSLKQSSKLTEGHISELFLLSLTLIGINILGLLALVVGLFWTVPLTALAQAYLYRRLSSKA